MQRPPHWRALPRLSQPADGETCLWPGREMLSCVCGSPGAIYTIVQLDNQHWCTTVRKSLQVDPLELVANADACVTTPSVTSHPARLAGTVHLQASCPKVLEAIL